MSSNNNNMSPEAMIGIMVITVIGLAFMVIAALFAFAAIVLTFIAIAAWNEPLIVGDDIVHPDEARAYVWRGVVGAIALPLFAVFCSVVFQFDLKEITDHGWLLILLAGYSGGSLGIEIAIQQAREEAAAAAAIQQEILPPLPAPQPKPTQTQSTKPAEDFEFARWDDEEIEQ